MPIRPRDLAVLATCFALAGCDKLKSAMGKAEDGGVSPSSAAGGNGGLLSLLGGDFEGEISATITTKGKAQSGAPQAVVFGIKKPKYRIDINETTARTTARPELGQGGTVLVDPPTKKGYMLVHPQKMAMVLDFEKMKTMPKLPGMPNAPKGTPTAAPSQPPKVDKTGKKDVVAGYSCEVWNIASDGHKAEVCVADGITWIDLGDLGWSSPELTAAAVVTGANHFPLRVITFDATGAEETRMEATKIEKKKLDDARFAVPADYRVVDMGAMMGGLGTLNRGNGLPSKPTIPPPKLH